MESQYSSEKEVEVPYSTRDFLSKFATKVLHFVYKRHKNMVDIAAVKEFIQHPVYVCFIERLQKERGLYMSENLPSLAMLNYSANTINKSKVSIKELLNLLSAEKESLSRYVLACIDRASKDDDLEDEFPEGEEQDPSEDPNDGVLFPCDRDFAIFPVVLFYISRTSPMRFCLF